VIDIGIDESLSPANHKLVLSAIVGNTPQMRKMDAEWKRDLARNGVEYFHAKDHWNLRAKPYSRVPREVREELLAKLVGHLQRRFLFAVSSIVDESEYLAYASERFRSQYGSPYGFAFQTLMVSIYAHLIRQKRASQPVNIIIEDGHKNSKQAIGFITDKKKRAGGLHVNSYGLGGKRDNGLVPIFETAS
jgi:hypothetical protein